MLRRLLLLGRPEKKAAAGQGGAGDPLLDGPVKQPAPKGMSSSNGKLGINLLLQGVSTVSSFELARKKAKLFRAGTREWLFETVQRRLKGDDSCCVIAADPGVGKSCFMAELATRFYPALESGRLQRAGAAGDLEVAAMHFFAYSDQTERTADKCIMSLAAQLCVSLPRFRDQLGGDGEAIEKILGAARRLEKDHVQRARHLLYELIIRPCFALSDPRKQYVLLLDALDECEHADALTQAISEFWGKNSFEVTAPKWLKVVVSTRREVSTLNRLKDFRPLEIKLQTDKEEALTEEERVLKEENLKDIRMCLIDWLGAGAVDGEKEKLVEQLVEKSEGVFLWLAYHEESLRGLAKNKSNNLIAAIEALPKGLIATYVEFLKSVREGLMAENLIEKVKEELPDGLDEEEEKLLRGKLKKLYTKTLGIGVLVPRQRIPLALWREAIGLSSTTPPHTKSEEVLVDILFGVVKKTLSRLLIIDGSSSGSSVSAPHKSLVDFLDPSFKHHQEDEILAGRPSLVVRHVELAHGLFAECLLKRVGNMASKPALMMSNNNNKVSPEDSFALRHVVYHALRGGKTDAAVDVFEDVNKLIRVEQAWGKDDVARVEDDLRDLMGRLETAKDARRERLWLLARILAAARPALVADARMLPGQIYGRLGMDEPTFKDEAKRFWKIRVEAWLEKAKESRGPGKGPTIAMPLKPWLSGLSPAGGALLWTFPTSKDTVCSVALGNDGKHLCVTEGNEVVVVDFIAGRVLRRLKGHSDAVRSVAISADSKYVVTGSNDKTARIWDLKDGKERSVLKGHSKGVTAVAISSDSQYVVTASEDKTARVWNLKNGGLRRVLEGDSDAVMSVVAISADLKYVVTAGSGDKTPVRIWDLESGKELRVVLKGQSSAVTSVVVSSDSKFLVTGSAEDKTARIWDLESGDLRRELEGHSDVVRSVAISSDSRYVVSGSNDKTVCVWDLERGDAPRVLEGHFRPAVSIAISSDSRYVVTGSEDKTARVWDLNSGKELVRELKGDGVRSVAVSSDSKFVVTEDGRGQTSWWNLETGERLKGKPAQLSVGTDSPSSFKDPQRDDNGIFVDPLNDPSSSIGVYLDPDHEQLNWRTSPDGNQLRLIGATNLNNGILCWQFE